MRDRPDMKKGREVKSRKVSDPTINDTILFLGTALLLLAGFMFVIAVAIIIGKLMPQGDYVKLGHFVAFHYIFFTTTGIMLIKYSWLGNLSDSFESRNIRYLVNKATYGLGVFLLVFAFAIIILHIYMSVLTSIYTFDYLQTLMSYK